MWLEQPGCSHYNMALNTCTDADLQMPDMMVEDAVNMKMKSYGARGMQLARNLHPRPRTTERQCDMDSCKQILGNYAEPRLQEVQHSCDDAAWCAVPDVSFADEQQNVARHASWKPAPCA